MFPNQRIFESKAFPARILSRSIVKVCYKGAGPNLIRKCDCDIT